MKKLITLKRPLKRSFSLHLTFFCYNIIDNKIEYGRMKSMNYMESGRLMLKSELEKRKDVTFSATENKFKTSVLISGVSSLIEVEIGYHSIEDEYLQLNSYEIVYSNSNIGEKRQKAIEETICDKFYYEENLFAPLKNGTKYFYGKQRSFGNHYFSKLVSLEILDSKDFELLATDKYLAEGLNYTQEYFYCKKKKQLFERVSEGLSKKTISYEQWNEKEPTQLLSKLPFRRDFCNSYAVDKEGKFYRVYDVEDENNIRIFQVLTEVEKSLIEEDKLTSYIATFRNRGREDIPYMGSQKPCEIGESLTYRELVGFINTTKTKETNIDFENDFSVPLITSSITIHSLKVMGVETKEIPIRTWVKTQKDSYAIVSGQLEGKYYPLILEGEMTASPYSYKEYVHTKLEVIANPVVKHENPKLISFKVDHGYYRVHGHGYLFEETPNFYKIQPVHKIGDCKLDEIQKNTVPGISSIYSFSNKNKILDSISEIFGRNDFIFINKDDVLFLNEDEEEVIANFYKGNTDTAAFEGILTLGKLPIINHDYVLTKLLSFLEFESFPKITEKLTNIFNEKIHLGKDRLIIFLEEWFVKMEKIKNLKKTS